MDKIKRLAASIGIESVYLKLLLLEEEVPEERWESYTKSFVDQIEDLVLQGD